jgi:hypothetical protein
MLPGHSFDSHAAEWFGREVSGIKDMKAWQGLIERATKSTKSFEWSSKGTPTIAHLARFDNKYFVVQFYKDGPNAGELVTAFSPGQDQLSRMLRLLD